MHHEAYVMTRVVMGFMINLKNQGVKKKATMFDRIRLGVKVFKGLAMNSLS